MIDRRDFLSAGAAALAGVATALPTACDGVLGVGRAEGGGRFAGMPGALERLEKVSGGRLGVAVLDTGSGERCGYRAEERFAMCSTFKMMLVAAVLERVDGGREQLGRMVAVPGKPLIGNSPLTEEHAGGQMTVAALVRGGDDAE